MFHANGRFYEQERWGGLCGDCGQVIAGCFQHVSLKEWVPSIFSLARGNRHYP